MNWRIPRSRWGARLMASIMMASAVVGTAVPAAQAQAAKESFGIAVPSVPDDITVPAGNKVFLVGHAIGTQNYVCLPSGEDLKFTLFTRRRRPCQATTLGNSLPTTSAPTRLKVTPFA